MAISVRLDGIHIGATGVLTFQFSDGNGQEFASWAQVVAYAGGMDQPSSDNEDRLRQLLVGWWLAHDPGANDPALIEGKTITLDFLANSPITVG